MNKKNYALFIFVPILVVGIAAALYLDQSKKVKEMVYQNPVFEPVLADPSVIRAPDKTFYAYGTEDDWGDGQGDRLIPILHSPDLIHWSVVGQAFQTKPSWHEAGGLWAPDVSYFNNQYYMYYAYSVWGDSDPGIGVATSSSPAGPFTDHGPLFTSVDVGVANSIDPMRFVDDDGTPYLFWGSFHGIYGIELSKDGMKTVGTPFQIAGNAFEASYIIKRNGYYYYIGSEGSCCEGANSGYHVAVGRAASVKGPYLDKDGKDLLYSQGTLMLIGDIPDRGHRAFIGPGHVAVIRDDGGTDWLIYHAVDPAKPELPNGATRRPLMIDPIVWKDGWPQIQDLIPSYGEQKGPYLK